MSSAAKSMRAKMSHLVGSRSTRPHLPLHARSLEIAMACLRKWICAEILQISRRPIAGADEFKLPAHGDYRIVALTSRQLPQACKDPALGMSKAFLAAAERRGDLCIGAVHGGTLVAYCWFGIGTPGPFNKNFSVVYDFPGQAYGYKAFTVPAHRGRKLQQLLVVTANRILSSRGFSHVLGYVNIENFSSRRMTARFKNNPVIGWAVCARVFGRNLRFVSPGARRRGFDLMPEPDGPNSAR